MVRLIKLFTLTLSALFTCGANAETKAILDPDQKPKPGSSVVWSPLFQASWDKLNGLRAGKPLRTVPDNPLINQLNNTNWKEKAVMPADGYAVYAGPATKEFAKEVEAEVLKKFGYSMPPNLLPLRGEGDVVFGVLVRDLMFKSAFFRSRKKSLKFSNSEGEAMKVSFFGTQGRHSERFSRNVKVLKHEPKKETFILSAATKSEKERIIIYRPTKSISIQKAIADVLVAKETPLDGAVGSLRDGSLHKYDTVKIPYLKLDLRTDFTPQLSGKIFYENERDPYVIRKAYQITKFELFEKGAKIRVVTGTGSDPFGGSPKKIRYLPRKFICDQPFFVFVWKDDAELPYFAAWIDSKDVLTPFKP